jgi:hypothetical protein
MQHWMLAYKLPRKSVHSKKASALELAFYDTFDENGDEEWKEADPTSEIIL